MKTIGGNAEVQALHRSSSTLSATSTPPTQRFVIIGCGEAKSIKWFRSETGYKNDLYVDRSQSLYNTLLMLRPETITPTIRFPGVCWSLCNMCVCNRELWSAGIALKNQMGGALVVRNALVGHVELVFVHRDKTDSDNASMESIFGAMRERWTPPRPPIKK